MSKTRASTRISISDPVTQQLHDLSRLVNSISSSSSYPWRDENVDYHQAMVLYFFTALMAKVVEQSEEVPRDPKEDSDEEPIYDTDKVTPDDELLVTAKTYKPQPRKSGSKLRERIRASHSHALLNKSIKSQGIYSASQQSLLVSPTVSRRKSSMRKASQGFVTYGIERPSFLGGASLMISDDNDFNDDEADFKVDDSRRRQSLSYIHLDEKPSDFFSQSNNGTRRMQLKFISGARYTGDMVYHRFHGVGSYTWPNGVRFEGTFTDGAVTGYGKLTYTDLSYYQGTFLNCILEGTGTYFPAGSSAAYSGSWSQGVPHGKGHMCYSEQDMYQGEFQLGYKHGQGTRTYGNRAVFSGQWALGTPSGHGSMVFGNRDYYTGEWQGGKPHGTGTYVWDARLCEGVTCSVAKTYVGSFVNGQRDGYGVQVLGMEGSKIASQFDDNMKTGAGIVICGDGTTIEKKPLFMMDNPVRYAASPHSRPHSEQMGQMAVAASHASISRRKMTSSRFTVKNHRSTVQDAFEINDRARSRIIETFPVVDTSGVPLCLPLHATAKDVTLDYHVQRLQTYHHHKGAALDEKRLLGRVIANNYVYLRRVYHKYATLNPLQNCCPDLINAAMSRLRLWQFLRDINVYALKVSLVDVDAMLLEVTNIHLESEYDPFETIYFWQFIHCILVLSFERYTLSNSSRLWYHEIFRDFVEEVIRPGEGAFKGRANFACRDLLPIQPLYELYKSVGEPHSARQLLKRICHRRDEVPLPCNAKPRTTTHLKRSCKHYVLGGTTLLYLNVGEREVWERESDPEPEPAEPIVNDPLITDLRVFRTLGPVKVMECITEVCASVKEDDDVVFIDYQISFLEFYEVLINLAEALSQMRKKELNDVREEGKDESQDAGTARWSSKSNTSTKKKGKKGKKTKLI